MLLVLPASHSWKNERQLREEGQSKIRGPAHSPSSLSDSGSGSGSGSGSRSGYGSGPGSGSAIATAQVKRVETDTVNICVPTYFLV